MKEWIRASIFVILFPTIFMVGLFGCMLLGQIHPFGWYLFPLVFAFEGWFATWWVYAED